jgi:phage-related protein
MEAHKNISGEGGVVTPQLPYYNPLTVGYLSISTSIDTNPNPNPAIIPGSTNTQVNPIIKGVYQSLNPGAIVELFELDTSSIEPATPNVYRFHSGVSLANTEVVWQGRTYFRYPIESSGYEWTGKGQLPRPTLKVANISGLVSAMNRTKQDLVGAKITRRQTFYKYMDEVNHYTGISLTKMPWQVAVTISTVSASQDTTVATNTMLSSFPISSTDSSYWETLVTMVGSGIYLGIAYSGNSLKYGTTGYLGVDTLSWGALSSGTFWYNGVSSTLGFTFTTGDTVGILYTPSTNSLTFYLNGVLASVKTLNAPSSIQRAYPAITTSTSSACKIEWDATKVTYPINHSMYMYKIPKQGGFYTNNSDNLSAADALIPKTISDSTITRGTGASSWLSRSIGPKLFKGKYYVEVSLTVGANMMVGIANNLLTTDASTHLNTNVWVYDLYNAAIYANGVPTSAGPAATLGANIGIAIDIDLRTISYYINSSTIPSKVQTFILPVNGYVYPIVSWFDAATSIKIRYGSAFIDNAFINTPPPGHQPLPAVSNQNISTDVTVALDDEVYFINRKINENRVQVDYELSSSLDVQGIKLPRRQVLQNICAWAYKGAECGYTGPAVADNLDQPIFSPATTSSNNLPDSCSKTLDGCKMRFNGLILPYGGFPGSSLI